MRAGKGGTGGSKKEKRNGQCWSVSRMGQSPTIIAKPSAQPGAEGVRPQGASPPGGSQVLGGCSSYCHCLLSFHFGPPPPTCDPPGDPPAGQGCPHGAEAGALIVLPDCKRRRTLPPASQAEVFLPFQKHVRAGKRPNPLPAKPAKALGVPCSITQGKGWIHYLQKKKGKAPGGSQVGGGGQK